MNIREAKVTARRHAVISSPGIPSVHALKKYRDDSIKGS